MSADETEPKTQWWQGPVECGICEHTWVGVVEIELEHQEPIVPLECPNCGNLAGSPE